MTNPLTGSSTRQMRQRYAVRWARVPELLGLTASMLALAAVMAGLV